MARFEPAALPDLLPVFYRRLFPHGAYGRWLGYGGVVKNYFQLREFSFTLRDDVYVRFQSFGSPQELERELQKTNPYKIDIGAVYSHRPNQHNTVHMGAFQPQEKELVFDIDMTDYDDVRTCCSSADICSKCWTLMTIAVRIIDRALVEDLGMKHRLWVYSGRRGVHCWVCDDAVRKWSPALRAAAVEYLTLVKGGAETVKKVNLSEPIHPFIRRSVDVVEKYFETYALVGQDILGSPENWDKRSRPACSTGRCPCPRSRMSFKVPSSPRNATALPLSVTALTLPTAPRGPAGRVPQEAELGAALGAAEGPHGADTGECEPSKGQGGGAPAPAPRPPPHACAPQRTTAAAKGTACYADWEVMLQFCFPRLDINVSKGVGHLLKSPFSVHPKTGRISVPLDLQKLDQFDPFAVPTISSLCHELDAAGADEEQEDGAETEPKRRARDYKRTSLAPYVRLFEHFVEDMERARRGEKLRRSDLEGDF
ncbi:DNA primase small subunit isoform 1-T1 [Amazona ochrocephala]